MSYPTVHPDPIRLLRKSLASQSYLETGPTGKLDYVLGKKLESSDSPRPFEQDGPPDVVQDRSFMTMIKLGFVSVLTFRWLSARVPHPGTFAVAFREMV